MEHSDYSCKAYCPWLDESPTSLRIIDSQTQPRQKAIPKKMKKLIDGDLAAISGKRSTKDRLKEKLRQKQEAKDQHLQETGNNDVAAPTDVEQKSGKQKKRKRRSKKAPALDKQENEAKNGDAKQVESNEKIEVEESGIILDGEISVPVDNEVNADTLLAEIEKDGELSVHIDNEINADTLLAEIEKLREEISVLVNNEVCSDVLLAEIEKLDGDVSEPIEVNADIILAETEKLSEEISVPIGNELNADTLLTEIKKLDGEISVPIDNKVNANRLLTEIEKLSEKISELIDNEGNVDALLAEIQKLSREISEPVYHQMNADTFLAKGEKPVREFSVHNVKQKDAERLLADTERLSVEITELVDANTLLLEVEKPDGEISESIDIKENSNPHLAEIVKFCREISEPVHNMVNADAFLAEIEKPEGELFVHIDNEINAEALSAVIQKLREEISHLVNHKVNADTLLADSEKLDVEISEPIDNTVNANILLAEIEKLSGEISVPIDYELNIETLTAEIKKLDGEISVPIDNKVNANRLLTEIEKLSEKISELIDNEGNVDALLAEIQKLSREISEPVYHQMNADTFLAKGEKPVREFSVHNDKQKDAERLLADTERLSVEITELVDANTLLLEVEKPDGEISESTDIKENSNPHLAEIVKFCREISEPVHNMVNADAFLAEIEKPEGELFVHIDNEINAEALSAVIQKLREEISHLVNHKVNADTLLADSEKLDVEISEPIDNTVNANILLAEIEKLSGEISVPIDYELNIETLTAEIKKLDGEISVPIDNRVNVNRLLAEIEKLSEKISELIDNEGNVDALLAEIEKLSREISEPVDHQMNADTFLLEVEKLVGEFSVPSDNLVDVNPHSADIQKPDTEIDVPIDNIGREIFVHTDYKINANKLYAGIEKLCGAKPVHVDNKMNTDTLLAEEEDLDGEIFPFVDNKLNADKHVAEIVKLGEVLPVPDDNKINADSLLAEIKKLDGETSAPTGIKINAYTLLGEIEKLSEEISVLVDSKTNVDTLLAGIEKLSREISEPIDNKVDNDILTAEVEKFGGTIAVPVYNEVNADTFIAEIQMLEGDISIPVDKEREIYSPRDNKLNANTLAKTEKDKITKAAQGASKKFPVSGQFRKKITSEKYSIIADNLHKKLNRNHKVEILMPEGKKLIGNMKSEVEQLRKKRKGMPDKIQSCINMEILFTDVSQRLEANKLDILNPEMTKYLAVATTARLGCESGFELYSVIPSQPSSTKQQLAAKLSGLDCMLIKEVHQEVLHMHLEEKTYTCLENFKQKSLTQIKMKQSHLVNEIPECEIKYCPVFSITQVISDSTPHTQVINNTLERKEKERLLHQNLMVSQELRDHFTKIMILVDDTRKTGFLFIEGILNQTKKMSKTELEVVKWPDVSNSVFMPQKGLSRLFILCCDSGPGLFDFLAAMKIHGLPNTCMSEEKNYSSEKFLLARMRQRFVLIIFCHSATGRRSALHNAILVRSWAGPVDFAQSDLKIYPIVEVKESALKVLKPWVKMKTKIILNIHSTLQNIRTRQKPAAVQMVEICRKASMIGSKITFESHDDKIQLSVNNAGQFNYTDKLNDTVSRYMFLQGQQEVLTVLETHTSQRGRKAQFMNFKIPITMTGSLIKPVFNKRFMENDVIVQHFEDLDGPAEFKNLVKGSITYIHRPNGKSFKGKMVETDFEVKIREKSKFRGSSLQRGDFHLNKKVNALGAYKKREESVHVAALSNLHVSRKEKNLTIRCHDDGLKEIQKYSAFDMQTVTKSSVQTTAIEAARKYIVRLHEEISKKLAVKQQTETVKKLPLNINIFPRYARRHELLKLRNSDRSVTAEPVQETNSRAVESMSIYDDNTPCSQINDEAPGQIHEHSENINIFDNLEQTHYGIRLCMFG